MIHTVNAEKNIVVDAEQANNEKRREILKLKVYKKSAPASVQRSGTSYRRRANFGGRP